MIPLALSGAAWLAVALWRGVEHLLRQQGLARSLPAAAERAALRSRLLASYLAINLLFWFVDPLQGVLGPKGGQVVRSIVLVLTSLTLFRGWRRDQANYRRESTSDSLRRQLRELPGLEPALDGRNLDALSPEEVFTLVKALPAVGMHQARRVYGDVMADMLRGGRLDQARTLLELQELRQILGLADDDHHAVVNLLGKEHPELLGKTRLELQRDELRQEVAQASIADFLRQQGLSVLHSQGLNPGQLEQLEQLRLGSGLSQPAWERMVEGFGPRGDLERQRLHPLRTHWLEEAGLLAWLDTQVPRDPPLRPLRCVLTSRLDDLRRQLAPRLEAAGLAPLPTTVAPSGDLGKVFDRLWRDSDPDTAAWVLMLERQRQPANLPRRLRDPRPDLATSPFLQSQLEGTLPIQVAVLEALTGWAMFADVQPAGLLWLAERRAMRQGGRPGNC